VADTIELHSGKVLPPPPDPDDVDDCGEPVPTVAWLTVPVNCPALAAVLAAEAARPTALPASALPAAALAVPFSSITCATCAKSDVATNAAPAMINFNITAIDFTITPKLLNE
jgi:hypothetical protein